MVAVATNEPPVDSCLSLLTAFLVTCLVARALVDTAPGDTRVFLALLSIEVHSIFRSGS